VRIRPDCRLCSSTQLTEVLRLADTPPANEFCKTAEEARALEKFPLYLVQCADCGHVQLPVVVDPERLFRNYVYVSGTSPSFVEHFRRYAHCVADDCGLTDGDLVVDVGSNDGTLLRAFAETGAKVLGVDPAQKIAAEATASGIPTMPAFFDRALAILIREQHGPAALVTANNVFAHADSLTEIALGARDLLSSNGSFVFEVQYLVDLVEGGLFDMVYHEHLSYHHVTPLVPFFRRLGMSLVEVERVPTHGGSIRCTVRVGADHHASANVAELVRMEREVLADPWPGMRAKIDAAAAEMALLFYWADSEDKKMIGYGAPAKMATLCHAFNVDGEDINYVVDDSTWKQDLYCPGTGIPVVGIEALKANPPGMLVVFAWNFAESIAAKLRAGGYTGRIVVPLPTVKEI
jgi:SAM-dependent methyltransferase